MSSSYTQMNRDPPIIRPPGTATRLPDQPAGPAAAAPTGVTALLITRPSTTKAQRSRMPWKGITPRIAVALLRLGESTSAAFGVGGIRCWIRAKAAAGRSLVIRLQQSRFGRFS